LVSCGAAAGEFLIVPTLGAMAQAMDRSLREGGLLRTMIDGLA